MRSKEVKEYILNSELDDKLLSELLEESFSETISGICNALFCLLKFYEQNKEHMDEIILILEKLTEEENNLKKLKKIDNELKYLQNKHKKFLDINQKSNTTVQMNRISNIRRIIERKKKDSEYSKVKIMENVIYNDRNLHRIETLYKSNPNILEITDSKEENLLYKLFKKYASLEENMEDEIDFIYQVISLFISINQIDSFHNKTTSILENKEYYLKPLEGFQNKKHVSIIIDRIINTEQIIPLTELEKRYKVRLEYPEIILKEMETFTFDNRYRYDFTNQETITIDNINTQCRDDAIYIEQNKDGTYTLYLHRPNTASLIPYTSLLNKEAQLKEEAYYLINKVSTLFPEKISYDLCSLLENVERNTMTYIVNLDSNYNVIEDSLKIVRGKIKVKHKMTYHEVDEILGHDGNNSLDIMLKHLAIFALRQKNRTLKKEIYRKIENLIKKNEYHESNETDTSIAANIVYEMSILLNYLPAKKFKDKGLPYLYRIHGKPKDEIVEKEINKIITTDITRIDKKTLDIIKKNLKETYLTSEYSNIPGRHYGLDKEVYSHTNGTSRLYSGTYVQYITESIYILGDYSDKNIYLWEERTKEIAKLLNERKEIIDAFCSQYNYQEYIKLRKKD